MVKTSGMRLDRGSRSRWRLLVLSVSALVVILGLAFSVVSASKNSSPQARITQIESQVECPSCYGVSSLDSNTAGAFAVRSFVAKSVAQGKTNAQILKSLENSYGPSILLTPPATNGGRVMATLPFVFVAIVVGLIGAFGFRRRKRLLSVDDMQSDSVSSDVMPLIGTDFGPLDVEGRVWNRGNSDSTTETDLELTETERTEPAGSKQVRRVDRVGFLGTSWSLYLGIVLVLLGIGSGFVLIRDQHHVLNQNSSAIVQAQNESQTILRARVLANSGQDVEALKLLSAVLQKDPNQPVALAYQGWLLRQAGEKDKSAALINQGQQFLEQAVKLDPGYPDARVFLGYVLFQDRHDLNGAIVQFKAFLADNPSPSFVQVTKPVVVQAFKQAGLPLPVQLSN